MVVGVVEKGEAGEEEAETEVHVDVGMDCSVGERVTGCVGGCWRPS